MVILQCLHIIILDLKKLELKKIPHLQDNCYKQICLNQIDYKNHVNLQMATNTFGLLNDASEKILQNGVISSTGP